MVKYFENGEDSRIEAGRVFVKKKPQHTADLLECFFRVVDDRVLQNNSSDVCVSGRLLWTASK